MLVSVVSTFISLVASVSVAYAIEWLRFIRPLRHRHNWPVSKGPRNGPRAADQEGAREQA